MNLASEKEIRQTAIFLWIITWVTILSAFFGFDDTEEKPVTFIDEQYFTVKVPLIRDKEGRNENCDY